MSAFWATRTEGRTPGGRQTIRRLILLVAAVSGLTACGVDAPDQPPITPPQATPSSQLGNTGREGWTITAGNVGLASLGLKCADLPLYNGPSKPAAGTTISRQRVTTALDLSNGDITIDTSCIQPTTVGQGMPVIGTTDNNVTPIQPTTKRVTIKNSDIDGTRLDHRLAALSTGFLGIADLTNNYVHHLGSGIALYHTGTTLDATVERNYVTDLLGWGNPATTGNHSDAFTIRDFDATRSGRRVTVRNNRFDCDSPNATGAFFIQTYAGPIHNMTAEGNLLEGGGYQLALEAKNHPYTNMRATNNRFSGTGLGTTYTTRGEGWTAWSDNYIYVATAANASGRVVREP